MAHSSLCCFTDIIPREGTLFNPEGMEILADAGTKAAPDASKTNVKNMRGNFVIAKKRRWIFPRFVL